MGESSLSLIVGVFIISMGRRLLSLLAQIEGLLNLYGREFAKPDRADRGLVSLHGREFAKSDRRYV
jgi:hypothetical protein